MATMTDKGKAAAKKVQERRNATKDLVSKITVERTEVLAQFCRLAGLDPFKDDRPEKPAQVLLQEFCQILVDYIAVGHFGLYERIVNGNERRRDLADLAQRIYPRIAESTQIALDFNDKYDCEDHCEITEALQKDLSKLGEDLAQRIELEDKLLSKLV